MNISLFDLKPTMDDLDIKSNFLNRLKNIKFENLLNLVIYGIPGTGKTTQIYAFLASILDTKVYDLKNIYFEDDKKITIYKSSIYHIEIDSISLGSNEKNFVQNFLKSYIETKNIGLGINKLILIKNAHLLSKQTQLSLRKILEVSMSTSRFIFEVSHLSNFAECLLSRCFLIRIPVPKIQDVKLCLINYSKKINFKINNSQIDEIINESTKIDDYINLKKVFGFYRYSMFTKKKFSFLYYEKFDEIINYMTNKKISFVILQKIRDIVNELYINLIPMKELLFYLFNKIFELNKTDDFRYKLIELTSNCDTLLNNGNKDCLHLEYYIVSIIDIINNK